MVGLTFPYYPFKPINLFPPAEFSLGMCEFVAETAQVATIPEKTANDTIKEKIRKVGEKYGATTTGIALAIAEAESQFRNVCNSESCLYGKGVFQIVESTFKESCKGDPMNEDDNISCAYKLLDKGEFWRWEQSMDKWLPNLPDGIQNIVLKKLLPCSCVRYIRNFVELPPIRTPKDLKPNTFPISGSAVIFNYGGVYHIGYVQAVFPGGAWIVEANKRKCKITERLVEWDDPYIVGFYKP